MKLWTYLAAALCLSACDSGPRNANLPDSIVAFAPTTDSGAITSRFGSADTTPGAGAWRVTWSADTTHDVRNVYAFLGATEMRRSAFPNTDKYPSLVARCQKGTTELYLNTVTPVDYDIRKHVSHIRFQIDSGEGASGWWTVTGDRTTVFVPRPVATLRRLAQANTLRVELIAYDRGPVSVAFKLRGAAEAIRPIADACHWKV